MIITVLYCYTTQGADIVVSDMEGKTALHWTVNNDNAAAAMAILVYDVSCHGDVMIQVAIGYGTKCDQPS